MIRSRMQGKQLYSVIACNVVLVILMYMHFEGKIENVREKNKRLEKAVMDLQDVQGGPKSYDDSLQPRAPPRSGSGRANFDADDLIVVYNRVPKTGSTSFMGVVYKMYTKNKYHVLHVNVSRNSHVMSLADQMSFAANVTNWHVRKPAVYHGHFYFLDMHKLGLTRPPLYINVLRDPLERLVSYYYFLRNGDDFRPYLKRSKMGDKTTFDECVEEGGRDCDVENLWLQIPFLCGHAAECQKPGSEWALAEAKRNLVRQYFLVGTTEQLDSFVAALDVSLPRIFAGAYKSFTEDGKSHLRKTQNKQEISEETRAHFAKTTIWKLEQELYDFAKEEFDEVQRVLFRKSSKGNTVARVHQVKYEKIKPPEPWENEEEEEE